MKLLGLTGSVGMGKTTTAAMFANLGAAVWDADAAVHRLYAEGGAGARAIEAIAPAAVCQGTVDRARLRALVADRPALLARIEAAVHPLVAEDRAAFRGRAERGGAALAVFEIPLLYETGADAWLDAVAVVTAPPEVQRTRVMARPGMTEAAFRRILARQMPDAEKRARADYVIDTGAGLAAAEAAVAGIVAEITGDRNA